MSLLMDALRKAEADKKQGAAEESAKSALTSPVESPPPQSPPPQSPPPPPADEGEAEVQASLAETVDLRRATRDIPPPPPPAELTLEPLAELADLDLDAGPATDANALDDAPPGNRTSTQPSLRGAAPADLDGIDVAKPQTTEAVSNSDPLDALMAVPESSRESGITETVASAATVFEAGTSGPSRRAIVWGGVAAAAIAAVLIGAGFYYFHQAPATLTLPSPSVAADVEKPLPRELPIVPVTDPVSPSPALPGEPLVRIEPEPEPAAEPEPGSELAPSAASPNLESATPELSSIRETPMPEPANPVPPAVASTDSAAPALDEPIAPASNPAPAFVPALSGMSLGQLRIARSASGASVEPLLNDAYDAYIRGDYPAAEHAYAAVLARQPQRRDALLGMAALKLRNGDVAAAHRMYREVLQRDPGNATARAALFTLENGSADEISEAKLKLLLDEGVDGGYIYFSLGNLYARKQRWPDAQQAYFEALRFHPANPDYNYNLAVSLDRIGQRDAAARYYAAAVELTDSEGAGFDPARALARLRALADAGSE